MLIILLDLGAIFDEGPNEGVHAFVVACFMFLCIICFSIVLLFIVMRLTVLQGE